MPFSIQLCKLKLDSNFVPISVSFNVVVKSILSDFLGCISIFDFHKMLVDGEIIPAC